MMIDVTVADSFAGSLSEVYTHMNPLTAGASLLWHSDTRVVFETADHQRFVLTGTGLRVGPAGEMTGGAVDALIYRAQAVDLVTFADLQTTGDALWQAFAAERDGLDGAALTHLLVAHCWTYTGNAQADYFPQTATASAGLLDLTGNDRVNLYGGNDTFFTGSANDTVFGGAGNDVLQGGADQDRLYGDGDGDTLSGGTGEDLLSGGPGNDLLAGNAGRDTLDGGFSNDTLTGGMGQDVLTGGAGADLFVFGKGSGADVIADFEVGVDHIHTGTRVEITAAGDDVLIRFGAESVLLLGISLADIGAGDFV